MEFSIKKQEFVPSNGHSLKVGSMKNLKNLKLYCFHSYLISYFKNYKSDFE